MKKQSPSRKHLSRPAKTIIHISVILVCLIVVFLVHSFPSRTPEIQFRQLEKGYMVGPSTILGTETISLNNGPRKMIVAETDTDFILYDYVEYPSKEYWDFATKPTRLMVRKKHGDLTILAAGTMDVFYTDSNFILPIVLYDDYPEAVRAEIEFYLFFSEYSDPYDCHFLLNATRSNEGYFCFPIVHNANTSEQYTKTLKKLWTISSGYPISISPTVPIPVTVRLYNEAGEMIINEIIYFRTPEDDLVRP